MNRATKPPPATALLPAVCAAVAGASPAVPDVYIEVTRARCKVCRSARLTTRWPGGRSTRQDNGDVWRRVRCQDCGLAWVVIVK